ncbi:unnamed protein product [Natator depressus]
MRGPLCPALHRDTFLSCELRSLRSELLSADLFVSGVVFAASWDLALATGTHRGCMDSRSSRKTTKESGGRAENLLLFGTDFAFATCTHT